MANDQRDAQIIARLEATLNALIDARFRQLHTCLPGIIETFDAGKQTASVRPAIKRIFIEGGAVDLPPCVDVPVAFPGGGDFWLTFPVKAGDECLLMFSERCIDLWHQQGGTQEPYLHRTHDLSDGVAMVGITSQPRKIPNFNNSDVELRSKDGASFLRITPAGKVTIKAPGGFEVEAPTALMNTPLATVTGTTVIQAGLAVSGIAPQTGKAVQFTGSVAFLGTVSANGKRIDETHQHTGVVAGGDDTGAVK